MAYEVNPEIYNFGNPVGNFFEGYKSAFIPQQLKAEQQENALKQQQMQQEMQYNPEIYKQKLMQMQLNNQNLMSQGDIEKLKYQQMQQQYQREQDFLKMMYGKGGQLSPSASMGNAPSAINPSQQQPSGNPNIMPSPSPSSSPYQQQPNVSQNVPPNTSAMMNAPQSVSNGIPSGMASIDEMYMNDPAFRSTYSDLLKKYTNAKTNTFYDSNSGQIITSDTLPSGKVVNRVTQAGLDPYHKQFDEERAKVEIADYKNALDSVNLINESQPYIDYIDTLKSNPEMQNVIGHFGKSKMAELFGKPEQKALFGNIKGSAGKLSLVVLNSMKGSSSDSDRNYAISMNPSESDSVDEFFGKYEALKQVSNVTRERSQYIADQIRNGVSPVDAKRDALDKFKIDAIMTDGTNIYSVPVDQIDERRKQGLKEYYGRY